MNSNSSDTQAIGSTAMTSSNRKICPDNKFESHTKITGPFANHLFQRLVAKEVTFEGVDFKYTIFDTCYLRKCKFSNCNFTGCRFTASNLHGSSFDGCTFDYAVFERTYIDQEILDFGCPSTENLKLRFARTLRANFQSLGDAASVNKAIEVELDATREHLWKAWNSRESYYRSKYRDGARIKAFLRWVNFKVWDCIWGNGESLWKLGRAAAIILCLVSVVDVFLTGKNRLLLTSYLDSLSHAPAIAFGDRPPTYPELYVVAILVVRLVMMGFFLSIVIKRYSRR